MKTLKQIGLFSFLSLYFAFGAEAAVQLNDGSTYPTLRTAVQAATNNDTLKIEAGTYGETLVISNLDLTLEGGYDATFSSRTGGDSILDAQQAGTALWIMDSSSRVDRVRVTGGTGEAVNLWVGGGILLHRSWVEFIDCPVYSNTASFGGGLFVGQYAYAKLTGVTVVQSNQAAYYGGGIFTDGRCDLVHLDTQVSNNTAQEGGGGGIWVETGYLRLFQGAVIGNNALPGTGGVSAPGGGIGGTGSFIEIGDYAQVSQNNAVLGGGVALFNSTGHLGRARLGDCYLGQNQASALGGGGYASNSVLLVQGVNIWADSAIQGGGGFYFDRCAIDSDTNGMGAIQCVTEGNGGGFCLVGSTARVSRLICGDLSPITGNIAGGLGGGLFATNSRVEIRGGQFSHNRATNTAGSPYGLGGGIFVENGYLLITNAVDYDDGYDIPVFWDNQAATNNGFGGAVFCGSYVTAEVYQTQFTNNTAMIGGGIFGNWGSALSIMGNEFCNNSAGLWGGALYMQENQATVQQSLFRANCSGSRGGAIHAYHGAVLEVIDCHLIDNIATNAGGGLYADEVELTLTGSVPYHPINGAWSMLFQGNVAVQGGGAVLDSSTSLIHHVVWDANSADAYASGIMQQDGLLFMDNCLVTGGTKPAGSGGLPGAGMALLSLATSHLFACTISGNEGEGMRLYGGELTVTNSIVWGNPSGNIVTMSTVSVSVDYSDIGGGWPGSGNIDQDPVFYPNYHLQSDSPCINAGAPVSVSPGTWADQDIDGESHYIDRFDMGFDEFQDTDGDRLPDIVETGTGILVDEINTGTNPLDPDSDGDRINDGDEWAIGMDPTDGNDFLHIASIEEPAPNQQVLTVVNGGMSDLILEANQSSMTNPVWQLVEIKVAPMSRTNTFTVNWGLTPEQIAYRIRAVRP